MKVPLLRVKSPLTVNVAGAVKLPVVIVKPWTVNVVVNPPVLKVLPADKLAKTL